ncbi:MAG: TonB-dependent receptor [Pseudomonadales bacterium]|nr:TonB-dependent receptor [Pseudomonadales bacterium]MCP5183540.1 TonB-dependent receptor [Pseudomonadales bacterium]
MKPIRLSLVTLLAPCVLVAANVRAEGALEEIVVTAQKREQSLQDVPFSVTAMSGESLQAMQVHDVQDLASVEPSLFITSTGSVGQGAAFRLRGFGSPNFQLGIESAVAAFVDGVYRSRSGAAITDLVDIDRVEILKGPQGTLFGKNATAGVLHIITNRPDPDAFEGSVELSAANYGTFRLGGVLNLPVSDRAAFRIAAQATEGDGWIDNTGAPDDQNDKSRQLVRAQFGMEVNDNLNINLTADYNAMDENCCATVRIADGPFTGPLQFFASAFNSTVISPPNPDRLKTAINDDNTQDTDDFGFAAEINWDINDTMTLTSITSYRDYTTESSTDGDFTGADILVIDEEVDLSNFSQELRLAGTAGKVDWTVGAYFADEQIDRERIFTWQSQAGAYFPPFLNPQPGLGVIDNLSQDATTYAGFAHAIFHVNDRFDLTAGVRLNKEEKDGKGRFQQPNNIVLTFVNPAFDADIDESEPIYTLSASYDFTDNLTGYATYSTGYKAGGINLAREAAGEAVTPFNPNPAPAEPTFDKETVDHWEIGIKGEYERLRYSVAYFQTEYDDIQSQIFAPPLFLVRNGESASTDGIEIEVLYAPTDSLTVSVGLLGLDTEYGSGTNLGSGPIAGEELPWAPDYSASLNLDYEIPVGSSGWMFAAHGGMVYRDKHGVNGDPTTGFVQRSMRLVNAQLALRSPDDRYSVSLWCRNCGDEYYSEVIFTSPVDFFPGLGAAVEAYPGRPREFGLTLGMKF